MCASINRRAKSANRLYELLCDTDINHDITLCGEDYGDITVFEGNKAIDLVLEYNFKLKEHTDIAEIVNQATYLKAHIGTTGCSHGLCIAAYDDDVQTMHILAWFVTMHGRGRIFQLSITPEPDGIIRPDGIKFIEHHYQSKKILFKKTEKKAIDGKMYVNNYYDDSLASLYPLDDVDCENEIFVCEQTKTETGKLELFTKELK